jgi:UDP-N-acetylglucosamine acyltransferase
MATAHIAHDCHMTIIIVNGVALAGHVTVGKFAVIGGLQQHQFIHIGDHAMISGGSLLERTFHLQKRRKSLCLMWD